MAGQIGFDEGGVLQALNKPIFKQKWTEYERNRKGDVTDKVEHDLEVSLATVIAVLVLYYGPQVLEWFKTTGAENIAEGFKDLLTGAANYAQEITGGTDSKDEPGTPEFEAAMRHSNLARWEFKQLLARSPNAGALAGCNPWRRANHNQRKMYRSKWNLPTTWQWPGCIGGF